MPRRVSRHKLSRKELVQKDEISARLDQVAVYIWDHPQPFLWGAAIVVGVAAVLAGWSIYSGRRDAAAQVALGAVIQAYQDTATFASDEARYQDTLTRATHVDEDFGGSSAARVARYYAALSHEGLGEADQAQSILEELGASSDPAIRPIAHFALGQLFRKQGEFDRAIALYQMLLDAGEYPADTLVYELGEFSEAAGQIERARSFYESLLDDYPDSVYQPDANRALKRLSTASSGAA